jgi:hypothetical protein
MEGSTVSLEERQPEAAGRAAAGAVVEAPAAPVLAGASAPRSALATLPERISALARAQAGATQLGPQLQYQIARLGPAGQVGLAGLVAALVFAASALLPARHALDALSANIAGAQHPSAAVSADQAAPRLVESLPTRTQIPAVIGLIYAKAKEAGVPLDTGHYVYSPPKAGALARYDVDFPVKAGYPDIRNFINRTLTAVPSAALAKLHVERKTVGDQVVSADIGFVVFVRSEQQP